MTMTKEQLAALLNGREYRREITKDEEAQAKAAGLIVIFGASDDLMEFRGLIHDDLGAPTTAHLCKDGTLLPDWDSLMDNDPSEDDVAKYFKRKESGSVNVEALWCKEGNYSWTFATDLPHPTFEIVEGGEPNCRGIVLDTADLRA